MTTICCCGSVYDSGCMKRVIVIGCPGSGKSTFSIKLHHITGLPLHHLDMMYWNADRTKVDREIFLESLANALQGSEWIIDGNYSSTMEQRMQACDTVIFLDYPTDVCLGGVIERRGKVRTDIPWTEPEQIDEAFIETVRNYNTQSRPQVAELLKKYPDKQIHIFTCRNQADEFLHRIEAQNP